MSIDRGSQTDTGQEALNRQSDDGYLESLREIARKAMFALKSSDPLTICPICFKLYGPQTALGGCPRCGGSDYKPSSATAKETGNHHLLLALALAARFGGWVTSDLVAHLVWPRCTDLNRRKYAQQLLLRAVKSRLLVGRELGPREWIFVLTKSGAARVEAEPATSWGRVNSAGEWSPPVKIQHDLAIARYSVQLILEEWTVSTWFEIERANPIAIKKPDGMAVKGSTVMWIEAERSRKTGSSGRSLCGALMLAAAGRADRLALQLEQNPFDAPRANKAVVLLPAVGFKDDRGCLIDHKIRVTNAVRRAICRDSYEHFAINFVRETKPWRWQHEIVHFGRGAEERHDYF